MTLRYNDYGRTYAICDHCDANLIDLPPCIDAANRITRTFFGWTTYQSVDNEHETMHKCDECSHHRKRRRRS